MVHGPDQDAIAGWEDAGICYNPIPSAAGLDEIKGRVWGAGIGAREATRQALPGIPGEVVGVAKPRSVCLREAMDRFHREEAPAGQAGKAQERLELLSRLEETGGSMVGHSSSRKATAKDRNEEKGTSGFSRHGNRPLSAPRVGTLNWTTVLG
jgi:hypothetical protein